MRNKARPYLFSNTVAPAVVRGTIQVLDMLSSTTYLRDKLENNTKYFRAMMTEAGFDIVPGDHPIVPIMFGKYPDCSKLAVQFANRMLEEGVYVIAFSFPVVPRGKDRIRVQISAGHDQHHLDHAIDAFVKVGKELGMIK
jgi:glycine C-acetyltransferase